MVNYDVEKTEECGEEVIILKEKKEEKSVGKQMFQLMIYFASVIVISLLINTFLFQKIQVDGKSMMPNLSNEDQLILEKVSYYFNPPKRFDIVVFRPYESNQKTFYIKRVIGLPGETVQIKDGDIYINGTKLKESYGNEKMDFAGIASQGLTLKENEYFMLGDNRNGSKDSRDESVGIVGRDQITGRAAYCIWPIRNFGKIH